mgnify:CR=1 FL=1
MLTNRINVTYNIENIDADFDIFRVEKSNKDYYKYNILDSAVYEFNEFILRNFKSHLKAFFERISFTSLLSFLFSYPSIERYSLLATL